MELLDERVLSALDGRVFTPAKLREILKMARRQLRERTAADRQKLAHLQADLRKAEGRLGRLYEAVESGLLPLDETMQPRVQQAEAGREAELVEMAGLRRLQQLPSEQVLPSQVEAFSKVVRAKLRDRGSPFARDYLRAVVDSVVVDGDTATISGSNARLVAAIVGKKTGTDQVPNLIPDWRANEDESGHWCEVVLLA